MLLVYVPSIFLALHVELFDNNFFRSEFINQPRKISICTLNCFIILHVEPDLARRNADGITRSNFLNYTTGCIRPGHAAFFIGGYRQLKRLILNTFPIIIPSFLIRLINIQVTEDWTPMEY